MSGDIILKQGDIGRHFYFIHQGIAEVVHEYEDFMFLDPIAKQEYMSHTKVKKQDDKIESIYQPNKKF